MSILKSGEVGRIGLNQLTEQRQIIAEKWGGLGLLDGLKGHVRDNIAQLFENQAASMLKESTDTAGSNGSFETVAFPIVRRIFSKLLANDIVSVQALSLPIGKLFYMNPKISVTQTSYDGAYENAADQSSKTQYQEKSLYDSYYGNTDFYGTDEGLFDRSKGKATEVTVAGGDKALTIAADKKSALLTISGLTTTDQGKLKDAEGNMIDTESFLSSLQVLSGIALTVADGTGHTSAVASGASLPFHVKPQTWGKGIASPDGKITIEVDLSFPKGGEYVALGGAAGAAITAANLTVKYKTYAKLEENSEMAEVTFDIDEVVVSTVTRKMRANWTPEIAQDVQAFQNIDAEAELTTLLSEQLAAEIDREILRDLRNGAAWVNRWDYNGAREQSTVYYGTQKDYNQTLITKINQISAQIQKATLRGGVSWVVVSPEISAVFDDLEYFHVSNADAEENKYNMGIEKIGSLQGRYTVYKDNFAPASTLLVGHKGNSILESGYIYAPYVPMQLTPVMTDTRDFKSVRGIMTRYAKKMVNNRFYGKVLVDGIPTFDMQF